jgi:blocked-early-in-transport protein 1
MRQRSNNNNSNGSSNSNNSSSNMYRNSGSGNYNPSSLEAGRDTNANILETQNNDRISELSEQVARLKGLTIDIGNEVKEQNSLLDDMGDGFSGVSDMLGTSLKRIGTMLSTGGAKHMCYLVTFVVAIMVFLYWVSYFECNNNTVL